MAEDAPTEDLSEDTREAQDSQPESLRVDSLAQVLGTTSERVIQALTELDGRPRSADSTVEEDEAQRVREALADGAEAPQTPQVVDAAESADAAEPSNGEEPESRLLLETPTEEAPERAEYMPLFVAPQPVRFDYDAADDDEDDTDDDDDDGQDSDDDQSERPSGRRRRRGRRGRGRGRGEQNGDDADGEGDAGQGGSQGTDQNGDDSDDSDEDNGDDESTGADGATRRRRRRRRRKSGSGDDSDAGSPDDPPNTVVHEREPRKSTRNDKAGSGDGEIQGISGSTRLEAKRQRRRDGRDAGRRRPPILSEAEFLARREAVERMMVVRDKVRTEPPHEGARYTQIAVLEDGVVVEHFVTSAASASLVGNIYLGIVQNVLPSMEAAFVDIGRGRNGVLYAGEVNWEAAGLGGAARKIEQALKPGDYVVVQVSKDPVGHKGARLTTQVSLAGRYLVYVPGASSTGISRKLPDTERQRLKEILREVVPPDAGVIIRTASEGVKEEDIRNDVERLAKRWSEIEAKAADITAKKAGAAVALYEEPDVLVKVIRDLFNEDFTGLTVSGDDAWNTINDYVNSVAPELLPRLTKYEPASPDGPDVFAVHRIDEQLTKAMDRKVWLPSGGTLVIDRTEAMTVVDVNTGKFTGSGGNLEQTVTRNNLEAAEEIVRQLRLRDIGGIVVIDFIDMVLESNRDLVLRRLTEALARDRTRHQVSEVTSLGLVQLTRKRLGTGLVEAFSTPCTHCGGRGIVLHGDPVDSTSSGGRKSDTGGRRGKRGKRGGKADDVAVAKVPPHPAGEHPMFKAMAAANGRHDADDDTDDDTTDDERRKQKPKETAETDAEARAEASSEAIRTAVIESGEDDIEDLEDEDFDESDEDDDEDSEDEDEIDLDSDDDEDDIDDDIEVIGADDSDDDSDDDSEDDDSEDDDEDSEDEDSYEDDESGDYNPRGVASATVSGGRHRRRAAARPAGPPRRED
ncbi:ribonuclease [Mycobacterium sp. IS-1590]|uniref:translation initiation factor IF-2 N-terminal domain-containing protein n=1 Tax=Mycobacterium sp. IS-1590 TaxID=1772286 RepID=UPI000746529A|nr:translation initiation factor IF-2 N-terminal domain-containing protein [Mycobacterium sp. IS-1590]KUI34419.1 ribonuclease [Mycobacterium sp. IS-1590]